MTTVLFVINASNKYSDCNRRLAQEHTYLRMGRLVYSQWKLSLLLFYEAFESIWNPKYPIDTHRWYYCFIIFFHSDRIRSDVLPIDDDIQRWGIKKTQMSLLFRIWFFSLLRFDLKCEREKEEKGTRKMRINNKRHD